MYAAAPLPPFACYVLACAMQARTPTQPTQLDARTTFRAGDMTTNPPPISTTASQARRRASSISTPSCAAASLSVAWHADGSHARPQLQRTRCLMDCSISPASRRDGLERLGLLQLRAVAVRVVQAAEQPRKHGHQGAHQPPPQAGDAHAQGQEPKPVLVAVDADGARVLPLAQRLGGRAPPKLLHLCARGPAHACAQLGVRRQRGHQLRGLRVVARRVREAGDPGLGEDVGQPARRDRHDGQARGHGLQHNKPKRLCLGGHDKDVG
mmetsp:Transcript_32313/g.82083  ORF Transcript_32313/g.82083 Transcript_32313/m.82083 type:complete len:267 (-) Transcript_32313:1047-1847(-)